MTMIRWASFYIATAILIASLLVFATGLPGKFALNSYSIATQGRVVSTNCGQHMMFSYEYQISGVTHSGSSRSTDCARMMPGDTVTIYYDSGNPASNSGVLPEDDISNDLVSIVLASLGGPALFVSVLWRRRREVRPT